MKLKILLIMLIACAVFAQTQQVQLPNRMVLNKVQQQIIIDDKVVSMDSLTNAFIKAKELERGVHILTMVIENGQVAYELLEGNLAGVIEKYSVNDITNKYLQEYFKPVETK